MLSIYIYIYKISHVHTYIYVHILNTNARSHGGRKSHDSKMAMRYYSQESLELCGWAVGP